MVKWIGLKKVGLEQIIANHEENERQDWSLPDFKELKKSMKLVGFNITPVILNLRGDGDFLDFENLPSSKILEPSSEVKFDLVAGFRRHMAATKLGFDGLWANCFADLTEADVLRMHLIENVCKAKIPIWEIADGYWNDFVKMTAFANGLSEVDVVNFKADSYFDIPSWMKENYSVAEFANLQKRHPSAIWNAINWANLHGGLKNSVRDGRRPYSVLTPVGEFESKKEQLEFIVDLERRGKRLTRSLVSGEVKEYLQAKKAQPIELKGQVRRVKKVSGTKAYNDMKKLSHFLRNYKYLGMLSEDGEVFSGLGEGEVLVDGLVSSLSDRIESLVEAYEREENPVYLAVREELENKKKEKSVLVQLLEDELDLDLGDDAEEQLDKLYIGEIRVVEDLDIFKIEPCDTQVRKTFKRKDLENMVETFKEYGMLEPFFLRPKKGEEDFYEIVVGEHRYWGAAEVCMMKVPAMIAEMDDMTASILRIEEDISSPVNMMDRANKLRELLALRRLEKGGKFTEGDLAEEVKKLGVNSVYKPLLVAGLDDNTKKMHEYGLLNMSQLNVLAEVDDVELRKYYAVVASVFDWKAKELEGRVKFEQSQLSLPFPGMDYRVEKIKTLEREIVNTVDGFRDVLSGDNVLNMNSQAFFKQLYGLREVVDDLKSGKLKN